MEYMAMPAMPAGPQALGAPRLNSFWDTRFSQEKAGWISWLKSSRPTRPEQPRSGTTHSGASSTREAGQVLGTPTREELMAMNPNYTESLGAWVVAQKVWWRPL